MTAADVVALAPPFVAAQAPALIVAIPLLAAAVAAFSPSARASWMIAFLASVAVALLSAFLVAQVQVSGPVISYAMGDWQGPIGIEYRVDPLNSAILLLVGVMAVLCILYAPGTVNEEVPQPKRALFYSAFLVCLAGLIGVAITADAFNLFVFLEISSLSTYILVGMGGHRDRRALTAAYNYLILGTIGATFYVIGVGFLYAATGTLNLADMAQRLPALADQTTVRAGYAFIVIGLGLKLAMYPLHTWLPNAYTFAPSFVTAFLASTATKVAFYALVRYLYSVFGPEFSFQAVTLLWLFAPLGVAGMLVASFQAVFQNDARRLFALSSVAQIGYMLLGLALGTAAGLAAGLLHLLNHAMMKGALFMALGAAATRLGVTRVQDFSGLGRVMPFTMAAFAAAALSLVGVPLTAGFISKWYLLAAALEHGWWWAAAAIAFASILAFIYVGRILETAYLRPPPEHAGRQLGVMRAPWALIAPLWVLAIANIWFGVDAEFPATLACRAATFLAPGGEACLTLGAGP